MRQLDETDRRIIAALDQDPRAPVLVLAQRLSLARRTVQTRLANLETSGVLRPHSDRVRPEALGGALRAHVTVEVAQVDLDRAVAALAAVPEVLEASATTGDGDLLCHVAAVDADDLYRVGQAILGCPGVRRTRTALMMRDLIPYRITELLAAERS